MRKHAWLVGALLFCLLVPAAPLAARYAFPSEPAAGTIAGLSPTPDWMVEGDQPSARLGYGVGAAGDVNGDGFADVIIGAYSYSHGETQEGMAFLYYGSAAGLSPSPGWTAEGNQPYARFGNWVGTAGDVNGDGYADVIVGANRYDNGQTDEGMAYVYYGSPAGLSPLPDWTAESNQAYAYFGFPVGTAGDVNGDGFADVIVGVAWYDNGQTNEGAAFVYYGSPAGLSTSPDWIAEGDQANARFGYSVGTAGDVNGDGFSDVIVGALCYDNGQLDEGRAFVYHGSAAGLGTSAAWTAEGDQAGASFGWSAGTAGDVNGDGYADAIVGAYWYDNGQVDEGRAFLYYGSAAGLSLTPNWTAESNQANSWFGFPVATAGDVNRDGYADAIIGAWKYDNGQADEGAAFVYYGSTSGLSPSPDWADEGDQASAWYGIQVSAAGDVNGDGYADVVVGAWGYDNGETDEGRAYVYYGLSTPPCDPPRDVDFSWSPLQPHPGEEVTFVASAAGTPPIDFQWQFGDGTTGSGSPVAHTYAAAGTYNVTLLASNACGQAAANHDVVVQPETGFVFVDIKPRSCPNPVDPRDHGLLPVAVLGTPGFDVTLIDPASVRLIGVPPARWTYEDVAAPVSLSGYCECTTAGPDGYLDLVLHFNVQEVIAALPENWVDTAKAITNPPGTTYQLLLDATLVDGSAVQGQDCIILLHTNILH